ncbi:formyl transferase domain-containing protein [Hirsutella rhossiliensis]|uniref:methionyl-tRNA formyltransferase n=1 Tax=Hirsutella rhossiliensis TaxID=111463 RepID=A0A9P8MX93_9HYPO|nr:formyl transferase domain-containing protein [Hirsutella rhossiliensis]KAH0961946.1 formyl transferase domain-containing protein [Hirsutella rhossiliensis]
MRHAPRMLFRNLPHRLLVVVGRLPLQHRRALSTAHGATDPLRILFCGSDAFSCESLRALHGEHVRGGGGLVEALDVMVLPPKRTGRGLKQLRQVPCKAVAEELGLRVHQRETFRDWELPAGTNLVVVVSFGLFVPPRILRSAKYGGLNVHPSLLPDLRGPAPIHHAMLRGQEHIGISLQTLDDKEFDHGTVLAQTPPPGVPVRPGSSIHEVTRDVAAAAAEMLVQGLRDRLYMLPHRDVGWLPPWQQGSGPLSHAPKVTKADAQIDWVWWTSADFFERRLRVFASVWTQAVDEAGARRRIIWQDIAPVAQTGEVVSRGRRGVEGTITFVQQPEPRHGDGREKQFVKTVVMDDETGACEVCVDKEEGTWVRVRRVKVEGKEEQAAARALRPFFRSKT